MSEEIRSYPLSCPQKNIWYTEKFYSGTSIASISATMRLKAPVDFLLLERAINLLIRNNDSMRIRIGMADGEARQYVSAYEYKRLEIRDFTNSDIQDLYRWDEEMCRTPLFAENSDLFRFVLLSIDDKTCGYLVQLHHIIADAWTMVILGNEIMRYYLELVKGEAPDETPKPSYLDFLEDEAAYLNGERFRKDGAFWAEKFSTLPEPTVLKARKARDLGTRAARKAYVLPQRLCKKIREHAALSGASMFATFMSAFLMYINRTTGLSDIVLGVPVLGRGNARAKNTMGMFISTVPFRIQVDSTDTYADFSRALTEDWMRILRHQRYPLDDILRDVRGRCGDFERLYDIVFSYQNAKFERTEESGNLDSRWHFCGHQSESLSVHINDRDGDGNIILNYDFLTELFHYKDIDALHDHFIRLLWHSLDNPSRRICDIEMVSEREKALILHNFNNTDAEFPRESSMLEFFERRAALTPDAIAVLCGEECLTYAELDLRAERLACVLRQKGLMRGKIAALMLYRSFEMMTAILAAWKAGAAYLPIDPEYPDDRIAYMLEDSGAPVLLTASNVTKYPAFSGARIDVDLPLPELPPLKDGGCGAEDLAYVIYTSGSTGRPKGVVTAHRALVNRIHWMNRKYPLTADDVILQKTTYTFDVSVWELTWWFYAGVKMVFLPPGHEKLPDRLIHAISVYRVTTMHFVPSMLAAFLEYAEASDSAGQLGSLRKVFASGEALPPKQVNRFNHLLNPCGARIINLYGPTEAAIDVSYFDCPPGVEQRRIPIGKPIDNIRLYILDRHMNLQPVGVAGELCIGGVGLAEGYLNRPELTAEKFVPNPFIPGERLYKTGDLARWFPRGDIEYLGRIDHQVKIRGFRIELGDIRYHLEQHPEVQEAAAVCREITEGDKFLCAYYVSQSGAQPAELKAFLAGQLPEYMVPAHFVQVDSIPLSHNGKANLSLLPVPDATAFAAPPRERVAPRGYMEALVLKIWSEVLCTDDISVTDNFFEVGGDSISAIDMVCRMPRPVNVSRLYEYPVLEDFARNCGETGGGRILTLLAGAEGAESSYILCPYGGGGAYVYRELADAITRRDPGAAVYSVSLPGHDLGADSGGLLSVPDAAALILREASEAVRGRVVIYAHCVGSALGVELARLLELSGQPPAALCLGGVIPPAGVGLYGSFFDPWCWVGDRRLMDFLKKLGLPAANLSGDGAAALLRAFRHDVRAYYRYLAAFVREKRPKLKTPVYTVTGHLDMLTRGGRALRGWELVSEQPAGLTELAGAGHYFTKTHAAELSQLLAATLPEEVSCCV